MVLPRPIIEAIEEKRACRSRWIATKNPIFKTMLNKLNFEIKSAIKQYKQEKWEKFCVNLNSYSASDSLLWRKLRSLESSQDPKPPKTPTIEIGSTLESDPSIVANMFAENLEKIFAKPSDPTFDDTHLISVESNIKNIFLNNNSKIDEVSEMYSTQSRTYGLEERLEKMA